MATPLKINNVGGTEIKEFTTAEENYIAYQIGLHLATSSSIGAYNITTNASHDSVGDFTNTFFNEPVGTHPSTSISSGSTTTTIYQNLNVAIETDSDVLSPIMWVDSGGQTGFKQMPDADLNSAVDRYISTIFTNDYPGVFKLASSSPGPDYSVHLSSVFTDTRTDGTSVAYNIYRRDSFSAPTTVRPLYVRDDGGFDGIQAMTDRQIKFSFGQRAKTRVGASKIGTYQLRTSAQGAPTDPGTWVSAGSATDTKQTTADVEYTRDSTTAFARNYTNTYTKNYTAVYTKQYTGVFTSPYARNYTGVFTSNYQRAYTGVFESNYTKEYTGVFTSNYTAAYTGVFATNYQRAYTGVFIGNYTKRYTGNYVRNFISNYGRYYTGAYTRNYDIAYARDFGILYDRSYSPNYDADFPYTKNYTERYTGGPYTRAIAVNYTRTDQYIGDYNTDFTGFFANAGTIDYISEVSFNRTVSNFYQSTPGPFFNGSQRTWARYTVSVTSTYTGDPSFKFAVIQRNYIPGSGGVVDYDRGSTFHFFMGPENPSGFVQQQNTSNVAIGGADTYVAGSVYTGPSPWPGEQRTYTSPTTGVFYAGPFYQRNITNVINVPSDNTTSYGGYVNAIYYTGLPFASYAGTNRLSDGTVIFDALAPNSDYVGTSGAGIYDALPGAVPTYTGTYERTAFPYQRLFTRTDVYAGTNNPVYNSANYDRQYKTDYTGRDFRPGAYYVGPVYDRGYTNFYQIAYTRNFNAAYSRGFLTNYARDYTTDYVSVTDVAYQTNYTHVDTINYQRAYTHVDNIAYAKAYTHVDTINYVGTYTHIDTINYAKAYTHVDTINYLTSYTHVDNVPYTSIFTNTFDAQYQTDYIGNFIGNFVGETIQSGSQTEETYTLYVRIG